MTHDPASAASPVPDTPAALGERLIYLKQRARHCRRVAQASANPAVAAALEEMAARYEAEILSMAPPRAQR